MSKQIHEIVAETHSPAELSELGRQIGYEQIGLKNARATVEKLKQAEAKSRVVSRKRFTEEQIAEILDRGMRLHDPHIQKIVDTVREWADTHDDPETNIDGFGLTENRPWSPKTAELFLRGSRNRSELLQQIVDNAEALKWTLHPQEMSHYYLNALTQKYGIKDEDLKMLARAGKGLEETAVPHRIHMGTPVDGTNMRTKNTFVCIVNFEHGDGGDAYVATLGEHNDRLYAHGYTAEEAIMLLLIILHEEAMEDYTEGTSDLLRNQQAYVKSIVEFEPTEDPQEEE